MGPTAPVPVEAAVPTRRLPCLVVMRGPEPGRIIAVERGPITIGRGAEAGIRLDDHGISRRHARLVLREGAVCVEDLRSTNGLWCNGRKIARAKLKDGDCLQIGGCLLTFRLNHPDEGQLLHKLYFRATHDPLTSLYNRATLEDRLPREVARQERYRHGLAVLQLDLDHFKKINDTHGHAAGDAVLVMVARVILAGLRSCDLAARVGGEEIVLVLPECDSARALAKAEQLRTRIQGQAVVHRGKDLRVTASFGVAVAREGSCAGSLLAAADAACYRAKKAGRNRVEC